MLPCQDVGRQMRRSLPSAQSFTVRTSPIYNQRFYSKFDPAIRFTSVGTVSEHEVSAKCPFYIRQTRLVGAVCTLYSAPRLYARILTCKMATWWRIQR